MSEPVRQHYIPRVYLKNFTNESEKVWVYDKQNKTLKELSTKDVTLEKHLYTIVDKDGNKNYEIEKAFGQVETDSSPIITKIIKKPNITLEEKAQLSLFIAVLQNRTIAAIDENNKTYSEIATWMKNMRLYNGEFNEIIKKMDCEKEEAIQKLKDVKVTLSKEANIKCLIDIANSIAQYFNQMEWKIFYTNNGNFLTSDNPEFLLPEKLDLNYGYGMATPGVQKLIPLSSKTLLCIQDLGNSTIYGCKLEDRSKIRQINMFTFISAKRFVIANNKGLIENIARRLKLTIE